MQHRELTIYCDGGARGNPGPAAIGVVVTSDGGLITEFGRVIGVATNNTAEYRAVIAALEYLRLKSLQPAEIKIYTDSLVVGSQLAGKYKVKVAHLKNYLSQVRELETQIGVTISYRVIPREQNARADYLVNQALDQA